MVKDKVLTEAYYHDDRQQHYKNERTAITTLATPSQRGAVRKKIRKIKKGG
jgi:hypothetical protein